MSFIVGVTQIFGLLPRENQVSSWFVVDLLYEISGETRLLSILRVYTHLHSGLHFNVSMHNNSS
jgi:hypothetical protein